MRCSRHLSDTKMLLASGRRRPAGRTERPSARGQRAPKKKAGKITHTGSALLLVLHPRTGRPGVSSPNRKASEFTPIQKASGPAMVQKAKVSRTPLGSHPKQKASNRILRLSWYPCQMLDFMLFIEVTDTYSMYTDTSDSTCRHMGFRVFRCLMQNPGLMFQVINYFLIT